MKAGFTKMDESWYSLAEASAMCGLAVETLSKYIRAGKIEALKQAGKWYISGPCLSKIIEDRE